MKRKQALSYLFPTAVILLTLLFIMPDRRHDNVTNYRLDKNKFTPDTTFPIQFPWTDVLVCFEKSPTSHNFKDHDKCPKCGRNSEKLVWIEFRSPDWTWEHLCGRKGPLSICPKCNIQVEFITEIMN